MNFPGKMGNTPCKTELTQKDIQFLQEKTELDEATLKVNDFFPHCQYVKGCLQSNFKGKHTRDKHFEIIKGSC